MGILTAATAADFETNVFLDYFKETCRTIGGRARWLIGSTIPDH